MSSRLRVLLIAEQASPSAVSVPLEGWSHSRAIAGLDGVEAHVVTQVRNEGEFLAAGLGRDAFTAIDSERVARPVWRVERLLRGGAGKGWTTIMALRQLPYRYFERLVWRAFGERLRGGSFDVVHRLTPLSPTMPSSLAGRCRRAGVPFVVGPLNGGVRWPRAFDAARRSEREWLSYVRGAHALLPGYGATRRDAAALIVGSRDTWAQMPARYREKCVYVPENGIDPSRFPRGETAARGERPLRVVFVGRLVPYKGADMLLEAAAELVRGGRALVEIVGDGPERGTLEALAGRLGLGDGVRFAGWVEHARVRERVGGAHVFGFPSVREFGGAVVLEAMAAGVAPLVLDYGGPGELVTEETGVAVPMGSRAEVVAGVRGALERFADAPGEAEEMGRRAQERVFGLFTWEAKARQVERVYHWVLGEGEKPDFGMPLSDGTLGGAGVMGGSFAGGVSV